MPLLSIKGPGEVIPFAFDFCAIVGAATITSATLSIAVTAGEDGSSLAAMLVGAPVIDSPHVMQKVGGGLIGCVYRVRCTAVCDDGTIFELAGDMPVATVFG